MVSVFLSNPGVNPLIPVVNLTTTSNIDSVTSNIFNNYSTSS